LIDRCEQLEFVSRQENPEDGRSVLIEVIPKGIQILEKLSEIHLEEIKKIGLFKDF
jgi:DNA-binding MarR family transcriptional regulator